MKLFVRPFELCDELLSGPPSLKNLSLPLSSQALPSNTNRYGIHMRWKHNGSSNPLGLVPGREDTARAAPAPNLQALARSIQAKDITSQMTLILQDFELNDHEGVPLAFRTCPLYGPTAFLRQVDENKETLDALLKRVEIITGKAMNKWSLGLVPPRMTAEEERDEERERRGQEKRSATGGYCRYVRCYKNKRPVPAFSGLPHLLYLSRRVWLLLEAADLVRGGRAGSWTSSSSAQSGGSNLDECSERSSGAGSNLSSSDEAEGGGRGCGMSLIVQHLWTKKEGDKRPLKETDLISRYATNKNEEGIVGEYWEPSFGIPVSYRINRVWQGWWFQTVSKAKKDADPRLDRNRANPKSVETQQFETKTKATKRELKELDDSYMDILD